MIDEQNLLSALRQGDKRSFSFLFNKYYKDLVLYGGTILRDRICCEDIVQTIFLKLWADREKLDIETSLKSFLLRSVRNACLDELRHRQVVKDHVSYSVFFDNFEDVDTEKYVLYSDLQAHLTDALDKIPNICKDAFEMNRFEGLKYKEIAQRLDISERMVELRVGKAIGLLRLYLRDFIVFAIILKILNF